MRQGLSRALSRVLSRGLFRDFSARLLGPESGLEALPPGVTLIHGGSPREVTPQPGGSPGQRDGRLSPASPTGALAQACLVWLPAASSLPVGRGGNGLRRHDKEEPCFNSQRSHSSYAQALQLTMKEYCFHNHLLFLIISFFWLPLGIWSSQARGQIRAIAAVMGSLTHCARPGIRPASQHCRDSTDPVVPQREFLTSCCMTVIELAL